MNQKTNILFIYILRAQMFIGPILDDGLKEKLLTPWKGAHSHFRVCLCVCLCVYNRATEHIFWPRNLIFGLSDP